MIFDNSCYNFANFPEAIWHTLSIIVFSKHVKYAKISNKIRRPVYEWPLVKKPFHIKKKISLKMTHISAALVHFLSEFAVDRPHVDVFDFVTSILQWRFDVLHDQISERWKWLYVGKVQNQKRQEEMFFFVSLLKFVSQRNQNFECHW